MFRRLLVPGLWEVATTASAGFTGAWLWRMHTAIPDIVLYYVLWFGVMSAVFLAGAAYRRPPAYDILQGVGLGVAVGYLAGFAALGRATPTWIWLLACLTGLASGLYWLALYAESAHSLPTNQGDQWTAWIGMVETVPALAVPPVVGLVITALPGVTGYRVVFGAAAVLIAVALMVSQWTRPPHGDDEVSDQPKGEPSGWHRVLWSMAGLGLRDGVLFFIPGLYLFFRTQSPILLGEYWAWQAAIQTGAFWVYGHRPWTPWITLVASLGGGVAVWLWPVVPGVFALGLLTGAAYPGLKVPLESHALFTIQSLFPRKTEQVRHTSQKELSLNLGRLAGFVGLWVLVLRTAHPLGAVHDLLVIWPAMAILSVMQVWSLRARVPRLQE